MKSREEILEKAMINHGVPEDAKLGMSLMVIPLMEEYTTDWQDWGLALHGI